MASRPFDALIELIATLRDPTDGCPWDRAQDHVSLKPYLLEEAHEAIAAIDSGNPEAICGELGDVLLQVVLHSQIAAERDEFTIDDVISHLRDKLVRRHPHVFADASGELPDIVRRWDEIKAGERSHKSEIPVLLRARKAAARASEDELVRLAEDEDAEARAGAEMLRAIAFTWRQGIDPELALGKAVDRLQGASQDA